VFEVDTDRLIAALPEGEERDLTEPV
jgi:hypothetical protein